MADLPDTYINASLDAPANTTSLCIDLHAQSIWYHSDTTQINLSDMADKMRSNRSAEREWPERLRPEQPVQMTDPNFHTDTGGWAEVHRDEWAQNLVGMLGKKVNGWAQNVRPGGFAMPEDRPSGLHVILTITTDGPTVDVISENVNRPGAYADGLGNSDGWAQSSVFGPGKGNGRAQSPMGKITSGGISGKAIDGPRTCIFARENGGRWAECRCRRMGPELNLISDNGGQAIVHGTGGWPRCRYTQLRWMGPDVDLTVQNVPNNDGCVGVFVTG
ncbi:hypothetical protein C8R48DRAFT_679385 [Suillus tomentosus]|nr:hypothetical protein C8R48DRAFT_679385 [Suillus tomentosus]